MYQLMCLFSGRLRTDKNPAVAEVYRFAFARRTCDWGTERTRHLVWFRRWSGQQTAAGSDGWRGRRKRWKTHAG